MSHAYVARNQHLKTPFWPRESCRRGGCRVCRSLRTKNGTMILRSSVKLKPKNSLCRFVTVDETLIQWYKKTKGQSKQLTSLSEPAPKKMNIVLSVRKVIATVFCYSHVVIYMDYLDHSKTVRRFYYSLFYDSVPNCRKNGPSWRRKKCSSTKPTRRLTTTKLIELYCKLHLFSVLKLKSPCQQKFEWK